MANKKDPPKKKYKDINKYLPDFSSAASTTSTNKSPILSSAKIKQDVKKLENDEAAKKLLKSNPALGFKGKVPESDKVDYRYTNSQSKSYSGNPNMAFARSGKTGADGKMAEDNFNIETLGAMLPLAGRTGRVGKEIGKSIQNKVVKSLRDIDNKLGEVPLISQINTEVPTISKKLSPSYQKKAKEALDEGNSWQDEWYLNRATQRRFKDLSKELDGGSFLKQFNEWDYALSNANSGKYKGEFQTKKAKLDNLLAGKKHTHDGNYGVSGYGLDSNFNGERQNLINKYSPKIKSTTIHEGNHAVTDGNNYLPIDEQKNIVKIFGDDAKIPVRNEKGEFDSYDDYLGDPTEVYARMMEIRNYTKAKPGNLFTSDFMNKIIDHGKSGGSVVDSRFFDKIKNPEHFKDLFNRLPAATGVVAGAGAIQQAQGSNPEQYGKGGPKPGELYNTDRANELGYTFDELGHLTSVDSETGMWLKSKEHPTAWKELNAYALNLDLQRQLKHPVINPEGYFGDNQLQYNAKEQYATGGLINNNNNNMIKEFNGDSHNNPSEGIKYGNILVEDGELEHNGYIFSKDANETKEAKKQMKKRSLRTDENGYIWDGISRKSLEPKMKNLAMSHERNRLSEEYDNMAQNEMAMSNDAMSIDGMQKYATGGFTDMQVNTPQMITNQQYDNNLKLEPSPLNPSGFNNRFASSSNFRPDSRFSPGINQPSNLTLAKPSLSSELNTQPSSTEPNKPLLNTELNKPSSSATLANPNFQNKQFGFEAVKLENAKTNNLNSNFTPSTDPSLINPQRYNNASVMPKSTASVKDNPVNIDQNANSSWGKAGNAVGYANAGINLGSTLYDTFKTPIEEVNQDVSQDAGYIADMEDIAKKRRDLSTGTSVTGAVGAGISAVPVVGTVIGGILAGGAALSQAIGTAALDEEEKTAKKDNTAKVKKRIFIDNRDYGGTEMAAVTARDRQTAGKGGPRMMYEDGGEKPKLNAANFNFKPSIMSPSSDPSVAYPYKYMPLTENPEMLSLFPESKPSYSVSEIVPGKNTTGPNTPMSMIGSSGNLPEDKKKVDWRNIAETAGMGLLSNVGNLAYLLGEGKDYDKVNYGVYNPDMVNSSSSRRAIRDSIATAREGLKESGRLDRASMAMLGTQGGKQLADAEERIRLANTGMLNDAQMKNIELGRLGQDATAQNKGVALSNYYAALSGIGENMQNAYGNYNLRNADAERVAQNKIKNDWISKQMELTFGKNS